MDPGIFAIAAGLPGDPILVRAGAQLSSRLSMVCACMASLAARVGGRTPSVRAIQQGVDERCALSFACDCASITISMAAIFCARSRCWEPLRSGSLLPALPMQPATVGASREHELGQLQQLFFSESGLPDSEVPPTLEQKKRF